MAIPVFDKHRSFARDTFYPQTTIFLQMGRPVRLSENLVKRDQILGFNYEYFYERNRYKSGINRSYYSYGRAAN